MTVFPGALRQGHNPENAGCSCERCAVTGEIIRYMMFWMPRSDRALWPVPAPRLADRS